MIDILNKKGSNTTCPVAIFDREGKILVGYRHYTADKYKDISVWTLPGGRCDSGETVEDTLRREVKEEIGIEKFSIEAYLGKVSGALEGDSVEVFLCMTKEEPMLMEPEKFSEWKWVDKNNLPENFINRKVREIVEKL